MAGIIFCTPNEETRIENYQDQQFLTLEPSLGSQFHLVDTDPEVEWAGKMFSVDATPVIIYQDISGNTPRTPVTRVLYADPQGELSVSQTPGSSRLPLSGQIVLAAPTTEPRVFLPLSDEILPKVEALVSSHTAWEQAVQVNGHHTVSSWPEPHPDLEAKHPDAESSWSEELPETASDEQVAQQEAENMDDFHMRASHTQAGV